MAQPVARNRISSAFQSCAALSITRRRIAITAAKSPAIMSLADETAPLLGRTIDIPEAAVDSDSRFLTVAGLAVHYKRWEKQYPYNAYNGESKEGEGPASFLCMHGFGASLLSYELCVPHIRRLGDVVAFDTPGFGRTQRPPLRRLAQYTPAFVGGTLARAFITDATKYILVGHSMGALVALEAAVGATNNGNNNICGLVLIAPAVVPVPSKLPHVIRMLSAVWVLFLTFLLSPILRLLLRRLINRRDFWQKGLAASRPSGTVADNVVDAYMKPRLCTGVPAGLLNFARAMAFYRASRGNIASRILTDIATTKNIPVLVVHGENDTLIPVDNSRQLQQLVPESVELQVMEGGHCPHEENPGEFAAILHRFLQKISQHPLRTASE